MLEDKDKFKRLINSMSEKEQIAYLNTLYNQGYVIQVMKNVTENIMKNEIKKIL